MSSRLDEQVDSTATAPSKPSTSNYRIIVGVDYGTTFTGISYLDSAKDAHGTFQSEVEDIRQFPGAGADTVFKVPSRIAYKAEHDKDGHHKWGYGVGPDMVSYSWTKLLLDDNARATEYNDSSLKDSKGEELLQLPFNRTAQDVVTV